MKKIVFLLVGLLILAFGSTVYAQPKLDFKASGFIDAQTMWQRNVGGGFPAAGIYNSYYGSGAGAFTPNFDSNGNTLNRLNKTHGYWESRMRLKFDAIMGKETSGTILFEADSGSGGAAGSGWGDTAGGQFGKLSERNTYGYWSGDRAALELKNVYFDFGVPVVPVPMTVRVGLQNFAWRPNLLLLTDGMGITTGIKIDPVTFQTLYGKAVEGNLHTADDVDVYGLQVIAKVNSFTIGGYGLYYNMNSYPFFVSSPYTITNPGTSTVTTLPFSQNVTGTQRADFWWLGLYADGKLGPVNINLDFIYDNGKVKSVLTDDTPNVKYDGWVLRGKVDYPWEKFNFGLVAYYATGADKNKTSATGLPGTATANGEVSKKVGSYVTPPGSEAAPAFGESIVFYSNGVNRGDSGIADTLNYSSVSRGPVGGTWMAKIYGSLKASPWYKVTLQGLYMGDTTKHGDTFGIALKDDGTYKDNKSIGWELDLIQEIQIYSNLKFMIGAGYLWAGSAFDYAYGADCSKSPKNPWQITTNLTFNF